ncbi:MAG: hypothetical protein HPY45_09915 [Anaerolineae bacterium]|nr:hypothetical protein [Anaerolineae bacterium]
MEIIRWGLIILLVTLLLLCGWFMFRNELPIQAFALLTETAPPAHPREDGYVSVLKLAPWTTPHHIFPNEWRFYAIAGETMELNPIHPTVLMKIHYLDRYDRLQQTWIPLRVELDGYVYQISKPPYDHLVQVYIKGSFVHRDGVYWHECDEPYCAFAETIDSMADTGMGISNGFIRHGILPPANPAYGYLFWQAEAVK